MRSTNNYNHNNTKENDDIEETIRQYRDKIEAIELLDDAVMKSDEVPDDEEWDELMKRTEDSLAAVEPRDKERIMKHLKRREEEKWKRNERLEHHKGRCKRYCDILNNSNNRNKSNPLVLMSRAINNKLGLDRVPVPARIPLNTRSQSDDEQQQQQQQQQQKQRGDAPSGSGGAGAGTLPSNSNSRGRGDGPSGGGAAAATDKRGYIYHDDDEEEEDDDDDDDHSRLGESNNGVAPPIMENWSAHSAIVRTSTSTTTTSSSNSNNAGPTSMAKKKLGKLCSRYYKSLRDMGSEGKEPQYEPANGGGGGGDAFNEEDTLPDEAVYLPVAEFDVSSNTIKPDPPAAIAATIFKRDLENDGTGEERKNSTNDINGTSSSNRADNLDEMLSQLGNKKMMTQLVVVDTAPPGADFAVINKDDPDDQKSSTMGSIMWMYSDDTTSTKTNTDEYNTSDDYGDNDTGDAGANEDMRRLLQHHYIESRYDHLLYRQQQQRHKRVHLRYNDNRAGIGGLSDDANNDETHYYADEVHDCVYYRQIADYDYMMDGGSTLETLDEVDEYAIHEDSDSDNNNDSKHRIVVTGGKVVDPRDMARLLGVGSGGLDCSDNPDHSFLLERVEV